MALEMPLNADSYCACLGVEGHHKVYIFVLALPFRPLEGQLSVSGKRMCTILVNRLED